MSEYLLEMRGIIKEFSGVRALNGIDLAVRPGECVGLCGENGAGKSTMMKVLSAVYPYGTWQGEILWDGQPLQASGVRATEDAGIVIIHQELMLVPQLSVAENIFLGREPKTRSGLIDFDAMFARSTAMLNDLRMPHINAAKPVSNYGGGEQQLIEIAKALSKNARMLILDEPTSSLTRREIDVLLDLVRDLKRRGTACVYISHKLDEIEAIADSVTVIRDGAFVGSAPMAQLKQSDIIRMMVGREMNNLFPREEHEIGEVVFEARNFTVWDPENRQRKRVDDISFSVRRGEIVGIAGLVGAGRTELVSAIFGAWRGTSEGSVLLDGKPLRIRSPSDAVRAGICMVPEDRKAHGIVPEMGVGQNMTMAVLNSFAPGGLINEAAEIERHRPRHRPHAHQDRIADPADLEPVRRQPAEGGDRQDAGAGAQGADPRRADPRRRCRRQVRDLQAHLRAGPYRHRGHHGVVGNAGSAGHQRPRAGDRRGRAARQLRQRRPDPGAGAVGRDPARPCPCRRMNRPV